MGGGKVAIGAWGEWERLERTFDGVRFLSLAERRIVV